jgi:hypothetical protein
MDTFTTQLRDSQFTLGEAAEAFTRLSSIMRDPALRSTADIAAILHLNQWDLMDYIEKTREIKLDLPWYVQLERKIRRYFR